MFDLPFAGEIAALLTTISWTICIFPFTEAARRLGPESVNLLRLFAATTLLTIGVVIFDSFPQFKFLNNGELSSFSWFAISGVIGLALGDYFGFSGFAILGPRSGSVFTTLSPAVSLCAGYFIVEERINPVGIAGILITICGLAGLVMSKSEEARVRGSGHGSFASGIIFMILSASCQGIGLVLANKAFIVAEGDAPSALQATWTRMFAGTIVIMAFALFSGRILKTIRPILSNQNKGVHFALSGTLFGPVTGVILSMLAVNLLVNKPSVAQTIFSLLPIFTLPVNALVYKEKITWKQVLTVCIACTGVIILVWREGLMNYLN